MGQSREAKQAVSSGGQQRAALTHTFLGLNPSHTHLRSCERLGPFESGEKDKWQREQASCTQLEKRDGGHLWPVK